MSMAMHDIRALMTLTTPAGSSVVTHDGCVISLSLSLSLPLLLLPLLLIFLLELESSKGDEDDEDDDDDGEVLNLAVENAVKFPISGNPGKDKKDPSSLPI